MVGDPFYKWHFSDHKPTKAQLASQLHTYWWNKIGMERRKRTSTSPECLYIIIGHRFPALFNPICKNQVFQN